MRSMKKTFADSLCWVIIIVGEAVTRSLTFKIEFETLQPHLIFLPNVPLFFSLKLKNKYGDAFLRGNNGKSCCGPVTIVNFVVMFSFWFL